MIYRSSDKPLAAISYDTQTYGQLRKFIQLDEGVDLVRVDPNEFLQTPSKNFQYINLVVKDFDQRKQISSLLDLLSLSRFTYIGEDTTASRFRATDINVGLGCMLFPGVWIYSGNIENDVIMHSLVKMAENVQVGNGCFFSGNITIAGGCTIGDWCFLGNNLFLIDNISVCDNVKLLPGTNVRKNIKQPGTYYNPYTYKIEKIVL
jgi:acetyltransferase-like isoleucine patch superfamily enzyme